MLFLRSFASHLVKQKNNWAPSIELKKDKTPP